MIAILAALPQASPYFTRRPPLFSKPTAPHHLQEISIPSPPATPPASPIPPNTLPQSSPNPSPSSPAPRPLPTSLPRATPEFPPLGNRDDPQTIAFRPAPHT